MGDNVLNDSSFELDVDAEGIPDSWTAKGFYMPEEYALDTAGVAIDDTRAFSGKRSVRLTMRPAKGITTSIRQRFPVQPGDTYRASIRYQAKVREGAMVLIFTAYDKRGQVVAQPGRPGWA